MANGWWIPCHLFLFCFWQTSRDVAGTACATRHQRNCVSEPSKVQSEGWSCSCSVTAYKKKSKWNMKNRLMAGFSCSPGRRQWFLDHRSEFLHWAEVLPGPEEMCSFSRRNHGHGWETKKSLLETDGAWWWWPTKRSAKYKFLHVRHVLVLTFCCEQRRCCFSTLLGFERAPQPPQKQKLGGMLLK